MNKHLLFTFVSFISILFLLSSSVEAKRFGGGSSFGSKKSYSSPFKKKNTQQKSFSQQKAAATNQQRKQQFSKRGGLMGMLGGLALGGLLGALFFGGAFENFNFFDFLIIGGIILAVIWFMKRKALSPQNNTATAAASPSSSTYPMDTDTQAEKKPDSMFKLNPAQPADNKKDATFAESFGMNDSQSQNFSHSSSTNEIILPDWFNQDEFLNGARSAYTMLQEAWSQSDLDTIKGLTTESVYDEIASQISDADLQGNTRILKLNAEMIDFNELEQHTEISVLFDALLDESELNSTASKGRSTQVKELWHFVRANDSTDSTWYLDGLQQLD